MDELVEVMKKILDELKETNIKLDEICCAVYRMDENISCEFYPVIAALDAVKEEEIEINDSLSEACHTLNRIEVDVSLIHDEIKYG